MNKYSGKDFIELVEQLSEHYDMTDVKAVDAMYKEAYTYMEQNDDNA